MYDYDINTMWRYTFQSQTRDPKLKASAIVDHSMRHVSLKTWSLTVPVALCPHRATQPHGCAPEICRSPYEQAGATAQGPAGAVRTWEHEPWGHTLLGV